MGWWGKTICTGIGAALLGPLGAGIGYAIGDAIDSSSEEPSDEDKLRLAFFVCFFACLAKIAKADGKVSEEEIAAIEVIMKENLELDEDARKMAIAIFKEAKDSETSFEEYISQFATLIDYNAEIGTSFLYTLYGVAAADGNVSNQERQMLFQSERILRITSGTIEGLLGNSIALEVAYQLLGCHPEMTDEQIKAAYRQKCVQFHPDKIVGYGLPPEFTEFANSQLTKLNAAYEQICISRELSCNSEKVGKTENVPV